jgi:hypothetical protein
LNYLVCYVYESNSFLSIDLEKEFTEKNIEKGHNQSKALFGMFFSLSWLQFNCRIGARIYYQKHRKGT